jgi:hypothetical protein
MPALTSGDKLAEGPFYGMHMFESHRNFQQIAQPMCRAFIESFTLTERASVRVSPG